MTAAQITASQITSSKIASTPIGAMFGATRANTIGLSESGMDDYRTMRRGRVIRQFAAMLFLALIAADVALAIDTLARF